MILVHFSGYGAAQLLLGSSQSSQKNMPIVRFADLLTKSRNLDVFNVTVPDFKCGRIIQKINNIMQNISNLSKIYLGTMIFQLLP